MIFVGAQDPSGYKLATRDLSRQSEANRPQQTVCGGRVRPLGHLESKLPGLAIAILEGTEATLFKPLLELSSGRSQGAYNRAFERPTRVRPKHRLSP